MSALFLPQAFKAVDGVVLFEGRAVPDLRVIALRHRLTSKALDPAITQRAADVFWAFRAQLAAALEQARNQRRAALRLITTTTPAPERAA